jgi:hypothetical protein
MLMAQDAGKAGMALDAMKFADGVLRVVTVRELKQHHPAGVSSAVPSIAFMPSSVKFGTKKKRGGKR